MDYTLSSGINNTQIDEEEISPDGIDISFGYEGDNVFGYENSVAYSAENNSKGLHGIHLSRELEEGERLVIHWRNGYELVIEERNGKTIAMKPCGGYYNESDRLILFDDDMDNKNFDYIETKLSREI